MKLLPTKVSEAATSAYKHHLLRAAAPTSTNMSRERQMPSAELGLQDDASMEVTT